MFIEFSFHLKLLFLLVFPISKELERIMKEYFLKDDNSLFHIFRIFLSNEFSFIFLLIFKCKNKSHKNSNTHNDEHEPNVENNEINNIIDIELKKAKKKNNIRSFLYLLFLSSLIQVLIFLIVFLQEKILSLLGIQLE